MIRPLFFIDVLIDIFDRNYVGFLYDIVHSDRIRRSCDKNQDLSV